MGIFVWHFKIGRGHMRIFGWQFKIGRESYEDLWVAVYDWTRAYEDI